MQDQSPYILGDYAPINQECEGVEVSVISGEIPSDLSGTYYRNGPNPKHEPKGRYHWFDGDGMLHALRLEGGKAVYRNRWVQTEALMRETEAGKSLWSGLMESTKENPKTKPYKDTANTDVVLHNGSLVCLWYICGVPYRVDANTLETIGPDNWFGGDKPTIASAHTKVDPRTGEMMFFNYGLRPPFMQYGVLAADGSLAHLTDIELPGPRLPHDMAITQNYSMLMDLPVFLRPEALKQRRWLVGFEKELPARFGLVSRRGDGNSIRWFEAEPCYVYHTINAWEEGDEVVMVGCRVDNPLPTPNPKYGQWARMLANLTIDARLHEWRFNLKTGACKERQIDDLNSEFPAINQRLRGEKSRYCYNVMLENDPTMRFSGLVKYDTQTGQRRMHRNRPGVFGSEAVFAPRTGSTEEDDGYVIQFAHNGPESRSEALIFDARSVEGGPLATLAMPQRIPLGFHACWGEG